MSSNICGNCANFKPKPGEKFFNCTKAVQAGVKYGMQVRPDTLSCDAFEPLKPPSAPKPAPKPTKAPARARPQTGKLCPWGRLILIAALLLIILLLSWVAYTCAQNRGAGPESTPTPTPIPTATGPTPTPIPPYISQDYEVGKWAVGLTQSVLVHSEIKSSVFTSGGGQYGAPAGTEWVWFSVTVININNPKISLGPGSFWLTDSAGRVYNAAGNPYYYPWRYTTAIIYPGQEEHGYVPCLVPTYATGLQVNYWLERASVPPTLARWKLPW